LEHLRLLSIFHYVVAGLSGLFSSMLLIHLGIGLAMLLAPEKFADKQNSHGPPLFLGWLFTIVGSLGILFGWTFAGCVAVAGRFLAKRKHYLFCLVMAGIACLFMPFGTVLGVFTIIVLQRPSVKAMFT
jgi:uncharacterized membrane protein YedE/YeeE